MATLNAVLAVYGASVGPYHPDVNLTSRRLVESRGWFIVLGFVVFAVVMAYAVYCAAIHGNFYWSFGWTQGFTVACYTH
jgi:hypothetical protein